MLTDYERERMAKNYLQQLHDIDREVDAMLQRRERYEALATRRTSSYSDMPRGGHMGSSVEFFACMLVDVSRDIDAKIDKFVDLTREADAWIERIPDEQHRKILKCRYLQSLSWKQISAEMGIPESTVRGSMHQSALRDFTTYSGIA